MVVNKIKRKHFFQLYFKVLKHSPKSVKMKGKVFFSKFGGDLMYQNGLN